MISRRRIVPSLLLLVLLAGQWLYVAHSHSDDAPDSDHTCQVCLHGTQFDTVLPALEPKPRALPSRQAAVPLPTVTLTSIRSRSHDPRAPPRIADLTESFC